MKIRQSTRWKQSTLPIVRARFLFLLLSLLVAVTIWTRGFCSASKNHNLRTVLQCQDGSTALCVLWNPREYFATLPTNQRQAVERASNAISNVPMWSLFVSNFYQHQSSHQPSDWIAKQGLDSISAVMMPKVASRSVEGCFLGAFSHATSKPRVGFAGASFWKRVSERNSTTDATFVLLRSPVSRFLSSLSQIVSTPMQTRCRPCQLYMQPCLQQSTSYPALVQCTLLLLQTQHDRFFDVHLLPQTAFLYGALSRLDKTVAVFEFDNLDRLLQLIAVDHNDDDDTQHRNTRDKKEFGALATSKFGRYLLHADAARAALNESLVEQICQLYDADVRLMRYLGMKVTDCD